MVALAVYILGSFPSPAGAPVGEVRVIILFKDRPDASAVARAGGRVLSTYSIVPGLAAVLPADALEKLRSNPVVVHVEPDAVLRVLGEQVPWGITRIEAPSAWPTSTGEGVKVAILDTGIQHDHPDLAANVKGGVSLLGSENSTDPSSWNDGNGHGTHVAGIVAAASNGFGVIGAAPSAWLYAVKVFADNGEGYLSDVIEGIDWCVGNGIKIINMSFGAEDDYLPLRLACDRAYRQGLLLVAAAGNEGDNGVLYPAKYDSVMAVAATDVNDVVAPWSSRGPEVELSAPGVGIYSTYINSGYASLSGTSMAAPHVAGAAALLWARCPSLANENVRSILRQLAVDLGSPGWDNAYGFGLVRTPRYEVAVAISPSERSAPPGTALEFEVRVTNGGNAADNYSLFASDELGWELSLSPASLSLGPGENGVAALTVTTPENAPLGSVDNIWVRATSRTDETVSASASCAASVGGISLTIAPSSRSGSPGDNLLYAVVVSNLFAEDAELALSATDNRGWGLELLENSLRVPAGGSRATLLRVSIPYEQLGSIDVVSITATSLSGPEASVAITCTARAGRAVLLPSDDAQVVEGYPNSNYGYATFVWVGNDISSTYKNERGFLKFDLSSIPSTFQLAIARYWNYCWRLSGAPGGIVQARAVENDNWNEATITWSNQPAHGATLDSVSVASTYSWYVWDITPLVASELLGDKVVSICMRAELENRQPPEAFAYAFESKEWREARPYLELLDGPPPSLSVDISANFTKGVPGVTLYYSATITNLGELHENYDLIACDNAGWVLGISPPSLSLAPGESGVATVSVRIPDVAAGGDSARIIVVASSGSGERDFASSIAYASGGERTGKVAISSPYRNYPYWFKGNLHSHTENSDGENTADEMMRTYRSSGYAFNAITDHNYISDSEAFTDLPGFVGINGEEITRSGGPHMVAIAVENLIVGWASRSVAEWARDVIAQGGIPIAAHPGYSGAPFPLENLRQAVEAGMKHMEIHGDETSGRVARGYWDELLAENRLVYGVMSDDAHSSLQVGRFGWIVVNAQELSKEAILRSLREGNFYCVQSSPPSEVAGPTIYGIAVENEDVIVISADGDYALFIGDNGVLLDNVRLVGGTASYRPPAWVNYVRVEVYGEGGVSYAQPLMISVTKFKLATLFQVCVDLDVFIEKSSKLVLKFYTYGGTYQGENVLWSGETTIRLALRENMPHPENKPVEQIVLELVTDNSSQTISRFVVTRGNLMGRITEIKSRWPYAAPEERSALVSEIIAIKSRWPYAPS